MWSGFALTGWADSNEAGILPELIEVRSAEVTHAGLDSADDVEREVLR